MSDSPTKSWFNVAGPYVAAAVAVGIALTSSLLGDKASAIERITRLETHQTDVDKSVGERLQAIENSIEGLRKDIKELHR